MAEAKPWDNHYKRTKSILIYPDENLVRMIKSYLDSKNYELYDAVDLGCGTGRHLKMLVEIGLKSVIGVDNSIKALKICKELYSFPIVQCDNKDLPFKSDSVDIAVSWGGLHYCGKDILKIQISEIFRSLKRGGRFFGTLRSEMDTFLKNGKHLGNDIWVTGLHDIKDSIVSFYSEKELQSILNKFSDFEYGIIERTIMGDKDKRISHWFFWADK